MSISITDLPADVVRRIPTGYRMWQLLRLTCRTFYARFGDYHEARGLTLLSAISGVIPYRKFIGHLKVCSQGGWVSHGAYMMMYDLDEIPSLDCVQALISYQHYMLYWSEGELMVRDHASGIDWVMRECGAMWLDKIILIGGTLVYNNAARTQEYRHITAIYIQ